MASIVVIVGRPNVGKSTLFNRISRSRDALVDNLPGVTRDRLYAVTDFDGIPLTVVDTGGFDDRPGDLLASGVKDQISRAIAEADRVIFVVDGREGVLPGDREMADQLRRSGKKVFLAVNKVDGPRQEAAVMDFYELGIESVHPVSAAHGAGIPSLMETVVRGLPTAHDLDPGTAAIRVAVVGRPNSGKSSLINRILGLERLLVSDLPGTTRDAVDTPFVWKGTQYLLIDTAGIRRKARVKERIETFSVIKALKSLDRCHIATVLVDGERGIAEQDARICGYALERKRALVLTVNKWDLVKNHREQAKRLNLEIERRLKFLSFAPRLNVSALTGERVRTLLDTIKRVYGQFSREISTPQLNRAIQELIQRHPPPRSSKGTLKFYYATQKRTRPPTFLIFVNRPRLVHFSYERFLINQLRSRFNLDLTPVSLIFRKKV